MLAFHFVTLYSQRNTSRHGTKPLKVEVVMKDVVALQQFALKALGWLQKIADKARKKIYLNEHNEKEIHHN